MDQQVGALVIELRDFGSERRHSQLLEICQERNLDALPKQALTATRKRLASENTRGTLGNPGAYYQRVLLALLEDHQVFVPKLGDPTPQEVHRLAIQSLGEAAEQEKITRGVVRAEQLDADRSSPEDFGKGIEDPGLLADATILKSKSAIKKPLASPVVFPKWEELTMPEKGIWQMRARQLFVENGIAAPSDPAVLHQARALWKKECSKND